MRKEERMGRKGGGTEVEAVRGEQRRGVKEDWVEGRTCVLVW